MPIITFSAVRSSWRRSTALAMPKSVSLTRPSGVTSTLPGLTSRWTRPAWWACDRAAATARPMTSVSSMPQATRLVEQRPQRPPGHELHHDGGPPVLLDGVVDADDVRVVEAGRGDGLAAEALDDDGVVGQRRLQQLDRDLPIEDRVGRHPHLAHAAVSQSPVEAVPLGEKHRLGDPGRTRSGGGHRASTLVEPTSADRAYPWPGRRSRHRLRSGPLGPLARARFSGSGQSW